MPGSTLSGWKPSTRRKTTTLFRDRPLVLHDGTSISPVRVAYECYGELNDTKTNAILICHALTGDSHVAAHVEDDIPGWWDGIVGPGRLIDTDRYFVVCSNIIGSCYGSEGPSLERPGQRQPWGEHFPYPSVGDAVRVQRELLDHLGIERVALVIGGSLGGQQALRWAVQYPDDMDSTIAIACDERASAWVIALQDVGRQAIHQALKHPNVPELLEQALATARMIAMISYRTPGDFVARFERTAVDKARAADNDLRYEVESYLRYQGHKLVDRFEARSYLRLTRMLDSFDLGEGFETTEVALQRVRAPMCLVGIDSDVLFDAEGPRRLAGQLRNLGKPASFKLLSSQFGHDAFLIEHEQLSKLLTPFLKEHLP
ncbi:MAG: homoserine O-acetyltransferase [Myxococcota bacterium]